MVSNTESGSMPSGGGTTTPRVATRRASRFTPRPFSSPAVHNIGRPPIVLEWGSMVIRVGYAEQFQPQHIILLPQGPFKKLKEYKKKKSHPAWIAEDESRWYNVVSPIIRQVFDRLMVDPTTRRVLVVASPFPPKAWEVAVQEALWNLGVPAVVFLNCLEVVPAAQGWNRGLVVNVGKQESHFLAYVDGHPLPFTYQVIPTGYQAAVDDASKITCQWDEKMSKVWLDESNPNSLVLALLKCLEVCPLDARKDVIGNILVCGDTPVIIPDLARRLALKLKEVLSAVVEVAKDAGPHSVAEAELPLTMVPPATKQLASLAEHVGLISSAPYRPDLISWVGGSIHAALWHRHDDQSAVQWVLSPTNAAE